MKKWIQNQKTENILFLISLFFLLIFGIMLSYNYKIGENYNLLFDSDTARVVKDAIDLSADHYRSSVHPLFVLLVQPVVSMISGFVFNKNLALIILSALVSSLSVYYLYKVLDLIKPNKKLNCILCMIYLFSFSNIIFTSGIETYNFAALFLILMWYFFLKQENKQLNRYSYIMLVLFGVLTFSFTITNVCIYLILILLLWCSKKIKITQIMIVGLITITLVVGLNISQKLIFHTTPVLWQLNMNEETLFMNEKVLGKTTIKNVVENDYYNSLIGNGIQLKNKYGNFYNGQNIQLEFKNMNLLNFFLISFFYIILVFLVARNFKKKLLMNSGLLLSLVFNTVLHMFYGNNNTFLYSLHFVYIIILLFGINYLLEENKKFKYFSKLYLLIFLIAEIICNIITYEKVMYFVRSVIESSFLVSSFGIFKTTMLEILIILLGVAILMAIILLIKKVFKTTNKETKSILILGIIVLTFIFESLFICIENINTHHRFLWMKLETKEEAFIPKEKYDFLSNDFKKNFKKELSALEEYKEEMNQFKQEYQTVSEDATNWSDYYYFGFGNRKKLLYRPNYLIDIETKNIVLKFEEENHYIVPNTYSVLIETKDGDFITLKEDEEGVHYILNGKDSIIEGTEEKIGLYKFEKHKYKNIMKVLYGEILWNIKDHAIYPNIIVYDKPWYRDAAITCMVLKETNNLELITEWVESITEMYDKQNKGIEEADNLGELLFILSTQEKRNEELIDKIEAEAEKIAKSNQNGYYIYGKTDFGDQYYYQNLWYKFGIEAVGRTYHFDLKSIPVDSYSKTAWWSKEAERNQTNQFNDKSYPYLSIAEMHTLQKGKIMINDNLYPLSWEMNASEANYDQYKGLDEFMYQAHISPLHSWTASEFLLLLMDSSEELQ